MSGNIPNADGNARKVACPDCGSTATKPASESHLDYKCLDCGVEFAVSDES